MNFAQKILEKYGWKEGDGLGKHNDGIAKPLKANLKFDNAGLGVDRADEFNNHWWERVFNEAADNVEIKKDGDKISVNRKNDESVEITTKEYSARKLKKKKTDSYDNFLSSATLVNTGDEVENPFKIDVNDIKVSSFKPLTDEELFAACGGRTAHKGARHGLKLSGKLARIEKQEKELLSKMQANAGVTTTKAEAEPEPAAESESWTLVKNKKKKNKRKLEEAPSPNEPSDDEAKLNSLLYKNEYCIKSKKKRKEKKLTEEELSKSLESFSLELENDDENLLALSKNSKSIKKHKKEKKSMKNKNKSNKETYRDTMIVSDESEAETGLIEESVSVSGDVEKTNGIPEVAAKKKNKKCKHGIDKEAKEAYKKAKKMKKKLLLVTQEMQTSLGVNS